MHRISCLPLLLLLWASPLMAAPQIPPAALTQVCSAIVYDLENDAILFEQNADERIPPASLTKVMSMFLAMDYIKSGHASRKDLITISPAAAGEGGSRMGLRPNETVTLEKLLYGMAVSSGNDASYAVAEFVGGSASAFVKMMNNRCRQLGMTGTSFVNPHGLPAAGQYTTARDMAALGRAYLRAHPDAMDFHNTLVLEHAGYRSWNRNPMLGQYPGANGLKTGWIRASGYNLIFCANRGGHRLLAVILGAPDTYMRSAEACRLMDAGFLVCDNNAVSVAAALDEIPLDLNRIDPLRTGREHGLLKKRLVAKAPGLKNRASGASRGLSLRLTARAERNSGKATRITAKKTAFTKAAPRHRAHAERKGVAPRRSQVGELSKKDLELQKS